MNGDEMMNKLKDCLAKIKDLEDENAEMKDKLEKLENLVSDLEYQIKRLNEDKAELLKKLKEKEK